MGDIGNFVSAHQSRQSSKNSAVPTKETATLSQAEEDLKASGQWGATRPRTTQFKPREFSSSTSGRALDGHRSITSLLLSRSEAASACKDQCPELPDIDAADRENPLAVTAYVNDIYAYYRRVEAQISPDYMAEQTDINDRMRAILVDWLVEVHLKFKLMPETLYLTTNLIDRYLAKENVTRKNLQLVGVTAMLLAAKYEEIWAPEVKDFVYISDKAYTKAQILAMEKTMLRSLGFNLTVPTPYHFMFRYLKAAGADKKCELLTMFFAELAMPEYNMLKYSSSLLSAAAVYTALVTLGEPCFPPALKAHCGYSEEEVRPCAVQLVNLHRRAATSSLLAVHKKYSFPKFSEVAKMQPALSLLDEA